MNFEYSFMWLGIGIVITIVGTLIVVFYRQIAENLANGVSSYDRVKLFGTVTAIVGLLVMANLHIVILTVIFNLLFGQFRG